MVRMLQFYCYAARGAALSRRRTTRFATRWSLREEAQGGWCRGHRHAIGGHFDRFVERPTCCV